MRSIAYAAVLLLIPAILIAVPRLMPRMDLDFGSSSTGSEERLRRAIIGAEAQLHTLGTGTLPPDKEEERATIQSKLNEMRAELNR